MWPSCPPVRQLPPAVLSLRQACYSWIITPVGSLGSGPCGQTFNPVFSRSRMERMHSEGGGVCRTGLAYIVHFFLGPSSFLSFLTVLSFFLFPIFCLWCDVL